MTDRFDLDDLQAAARASWRIAGEICTCEGAYHRVHPILRVIGVSPGIKTDRDTLNEFLPDLLRPHARILIAGTADAGLLHYLVENCPARPLSITIVDRCPAPLALIQRLNLPDGIDLEVRRLDLTALDDQDRYDLILSHDMMNFIDDATRLAVLRRFRAGLAPQGRLVLVARIPQTGARDVPIDQQAEKYTEAALARLAAAPDLAAFCGEDLPVLLREHLLHRAQRPGKVADSAEIAGPIERAGLRIERYIEGAAGLAVPMAEGVRRQRRSHIFIAAAA